VVRVVVFGRPLMVYYKCGHGWKELELFIGGENLLPTVLDGAPLGLVPMLLHGHQRVLGWCSGRRRHVFSAAAVVTAGEESLEVEAGEIHIPELVSLLHRGRGEKLLLAWEEIPDLGRGRSVGGRFRLH
jgi:hypothetical protein